MFSDCKLEHENQKPYKEVVSQTATGYFQRKCMQSFCTKIDTDNSKIMAKSVSCVKNLQRLEAPLRGCGEEWQSK